MDVLKICRGWLRERFVVIFVVSTHARTPSQTLQVSAQYIVSHDFLDENSACGCPLQAKQKCTL